MFFENEGLTGEAINEKLHAYKGHLAEFFDKAYRVYQELKSMLAWKTGLKRDGLRIVDSQ